MSSLLVFYRVSRLELRSVMLVFSTPIVNYGDTLTFSQEVDLQYLMLCSICSNWTEQPIDKVLQTLHLHLLIIII
jgi:hypothetical protein